MSDAPSCCMELLDKLQKWICRTVGPSLAAFLKPLASCRNVASLSLFCSYYFGRCLSELAQLFPLPYSCVKSVLYSDRMHGVSVTIPRCYKNVCVNSFLLHASRLWNALPMKCFPLTYGLNSFKSRINRHLLTVGFILKRFSVCFNHFVLLFFFCNSIPCSGCSACIERMSIKEQLQTEFDITVCNLWFRQGLEFSWLNSLLSWAFSW